MMKIDWKKWLLILLGSTSWSWTMVKSGWIYQYGMGFWGANGHDGIWHLALIQSLSRGSFNMPTFAGSVLQNYHIGFDLILAAIHRITAIPVVNLYFQIIPPILALLIGILTHEFVYKWTKSDKAAFWSVFFTYFGGSFAWIFGKGESAFWSQEAVSTLINPPFAMSLIFLLLGLIFLIKLQARFSIRNFILSIIFFGILIEIKAYGGALALGALFTTGLYEIFLKKKWTVFYVFTGSLILSAILYYPLNKNSAALLIWQPFWFLETMVAASDRFFWPKMAEAMASYKDQHVIRKFIPAYSLVFIIFYLGNLGTRILKEFILWKWVRNWKSIETVALFSSAVIVAGIVIPTFFLQKGTPWNTIQFFYYTLFFSGILAGIAFAEILQITKLKTVRYIEIILLIGLTIPTTIISLKDIYVPMRPPAMLTNDELNALNFLAARPEGTVLTFPYDASFSGTWTTPPKPLYLYDSTAYVSAFSGKDVFMEDIGNLDITGFNWPKRLLEIEDWYKEKDQVKARDFLKTNDIKYIYWVKPQRALLGEKQLGLTNIFEDNSVIIYKVD